MVATCPERWMMGAVSAGAIDIGRFAADFDRAGANFFFFFQAEDGIRDLIVTGVQTCALPIYDCFGLHFGERFNPKNIGSLAYVVINSPRILAGIENGARYLKVHNQAAATSLDRKSACRERV